MDRTSSLFGMAIAALLLLLLLPLIVCIVVMVFVDTRRSPLYQQTRIGQRERRFTIYKFRTMTEDRDNNGHLLPDELRLTGLGRVLRSCSLDEIPQLLNIVRGNMAFVGPRPLLPEYLPRYSPRQRRRHEVKPGITGWAQVNGRNALDWNERFELDIWYVDHHSLLLDVRILAQTAWSVLCAKGINHKGEATMGPFLGDDAVAGNAPPGATRLDPNY